jgi:hypothetical protein
MSAEESSNGGSRVLLTDGAAVAATSTGGAYNSGGAQLRPRHLTTPSHYQKLWLFDSELFAHRLFSWPFKDVASGLFEKDDRSNFVDCCCGVEQDKRWREFSNQVKKIPEWPLSWFS